MLKVLKWIGIVLGALIVAVFLFAAFFDWNMIRGAIADRASAATGRTVRLDGPLNVDLLTWTPTVTINKLKISNPEWAKKDQMLEVERIKVSVKLLPLFTGDIIVPLFEIDKPTVNLVRQESGRANWVFGEQKKPENRKNEPLKLPVIRTFVLKDGEISANDAVRHLSFDGTLNSRESGGEGGQGFVLKGKGSLNQKPFSLNLTGAPLINLDPEEPYPFKADIRAGATHVTADGTIPKPFDLGQFHAALTVSGDDLGDMYYLTGLALPNTPPYRISGTLVRDGTMMELRKFDGKVGDSDLSGEMKVNTATDRPKVTADLRSKLLDFDDLASLFGAPPSTEAGQTASPEQKAQAARMAAQDRLLPNAPLQVERIRAMDAELRYRAEQIKAPNLPLKEVVLDLTLDHGVLRIHPVSFTMPQGKFYAYVTLDARHDVPQTDVDARLTDVQLQNLIAPQGGPAPIEGTLQARAKLHMVGNSVHDAASTADGTVTFVIPHGEIRQAFAQLIGVNVAKGLGLLLSNDKSKVDLRCAVINMPAKNGVLNAETVVVDTEPVIVTGKGDIRLKSETLDLTIEGHSKEVSFPHVLAPITIGGRLRSPAIGVAPAKPAAQVAAAAVLGVILTPLASILPFIDPGLADNADCGALLAKAKQAGAPTK